MPQQEQSVIYPLPTDALLQKREVAWKVQLPDDYKNFIMRKNGFRPSKNLFSLKNRSFLIERFLCVLENTKDNPLGVYDIDVVMSQLDERLFVHEDILGFELVPIAALFSGDFICLNYIENPENPSICIWYHEESYELEPTIEFVANNFTEFLAMLQD
ncbi:SMI1/KNR4 family protein [Streptococcus infantis]|uniref:SMI1/KNR4 family protein n=1 Tax=Streptococcus infantis TaxID=68892 RepID=UPI001BD9318A|nr:SMI1/KNR4 family protein [Streptococcus infantis]MBT0951096.1 SMI1/KNR4 family protein [Streptococcus infantis]